MTHLGKILIMTSGIAVCLSAAVATHLRDRTPNADTVQSIYEVVAEQYGAIRQADFHGAYRHAASGFQYRHSLEEFESMARLNFLQIASSAKIEFGAISIRRHGEALVQIFLISHTGGVTPCVYTMVHENGAWKIHGLQILPGWPRDYRLGGTSA